MAAELDELLQSLGVRPPYVLVGHSLGGVYVQAYAAAYPQKVAALVLVEPTHPNQLARARRDAPGDARLLDIMSRLFTGAMRAEVRAQADSTDFPQPVYSGPVIVLAARHKQTLASDAFHELRGILLQEIATHYPHGELEWIDASHYVQLEKPEAVVEAINAMIDRDTAARATAER